MRTIDKLRLLIGFSIALVFQSSSANKQSTASATYLGNAAVLVEYEGIKLLFDPFFHNSFGIYQKVPSDILQAIETDQAPFDGIDAIFVSHAHGDHFSAEQTLKFLRTRPEIKLIAPQQAIKQILKLDNASTINAQFLAVDLEYQDPPISYQLPGYQIEVVRIPHAGWPQRADVSNLVYRVTLAEQISVIHMGDADPNDAHFKPLVEHWNSTKTDIAFPPYWFYLSKSGQMILGSRLNTKHSVGVHVPVKVPIQLPKLGVDYFSAPGEQRSFKND